MSIPVAVKLGLLGLYTERFLVMGNTKEFSIFGIVFYLAKSLKITTRIVRNQQELSKTKKDKNCCCKTKKQFNLEHILGKIMFQLY